MHSPVRKPLSSLGLASALGVLALTLACTTSDHTTNTPQNSTVNVAPAITAQPAGVTVKVGDPVTLTVKATGTPAPTYQWAKGGAPVAGATSDTLSIAKAQASDDGSYTVVVTNAAGSVTSSPAVVAVNYVPTITTQPKDQTVSSGNEASFTVVADGKPTPTFQWKRNGTAISGATAATYKFNTTPGDDGFSFTVDVANSVGTVTSTPAKLAVTTVTTTKPAITTDLADQSVDEGKDAVFSVVATGSNPLTYTWFVNGAQVATGNASSYTLPAVKAADTGKLVKVTVTNTAGSVTSKEVKLTVKPAQQTAAVLELLSPTADAVVTSADSLTIGGNYRSSKGWQKIGFAFGTKAFAWNATPEDLAKPVLDGLGGKVGIANLKLTPGDYVLVLWAVEADGKQVISSKSVKITVQ